MARLLSVGESSVRTFFSNSPLPLCFILRHLTDYVITSRGLITPSEGGRMCAAGCASTTRAHAPHTRHSLIRHAAIRNVCKFHTNNVLTFPSRLTFACSGAVSSPHKPPVTNHKSLLVRSRALSRPFLFDTNERTRRNLTCSQQTRKQFLFDTFERFLGVLIGTFERSLTYAPHFEIHLSLLANLGFLIRDSGTGNVRNFQPRITRCAPRTTIYPLCPTHSPR
jgi:hypothetical protein